MYFWANLTGAYEDVYDYASMCGSCHQHYDNGRRWMEEGFVSHYKTVRALTASQVKEARERNANGETITSIAKEFGVRNDTLWNAVTKRTWRYLK